MDAVALAGRILFSLVIIVSAYGHLTKTAGTAGYAGSKGVPLPKLAVVVTGLMLLVGGLSVLLGIWVKVGAALLVLFLVPTAFTMHNYWTISDPMAKAGDQAHFLKDIALAGAALMIFAFGTGSLSIAP
jgi:putative oxidoreductase